MLRPDCYTRAQLDTLYHAVNTFCDELAVAAAKVLAQFPPELHDLVLVQLQDHTSLYAPYVANRIDVALKTAHARYWSVAQWYGNVTREGAVLTCNWDWSFGP